MILVLATANRDKGSEMAAILRAAQGGAITVYPLSDYPHVRLPPEAGSTYKENASQKAVTVATSIGEWALGDDSGLEIAALDGAPGLYSARFAGERVSYADNRLKVRTLLGDQKERRARFVCTMALANPKGEIVAVVEEACEGEIAFAEVGEGGFGYDPIFYLPAYRKTFAELTSDEKNQVSHRGKALRGIMGVLQKIQEGSVSGCSAAW